MSVQSVSLNASVRTAAPSHPAEQIELFCADLLRRIQKTWSDFCACLTEWVSRLLIYAGFVKTEREQLVQSDPILDSAPAAVLVDAPEGVRTEQILSRPPARAYEIEPAGAIPAVLPLDAPDAHLAVVLPPRAAGPRGLHTLASLVTNNWKRILPMLTAREKLAVYDVSRPVRMNVAGALETLTKTGEKFYAYCLDSRLHPREFVRLVSLCPNLNTVYFEDENSRESRLSDGAIGVLAQRCQNLSTLRFGYFGSLDLTDGALVSLAQCGRTLTHLEFHRGRFTDRGMATFLDHCPELVSFRAVGCDSIYRETLAALAKCPKLKEVTVRNELMRDRGYGRGAEIEALIEALRTKTSKCDIGSDHSVSHLRKRTPAKSAAVQPAAPVVATPPAEAPPSGL